jgi:hypothetical protein
MKTLKYLASPLSQYVDAFDQTIADWNRWDSGKDGQIIFSDKSDKSFFFDENNTLKGYINGMNYDSNNPLNTKTVLENLKTALNGWN